MCQFIVYGLPRSRTAWLAAFLSYGGWRCHHDAILEAESLWGLEDLLSKPHTGTVETGLTRGFLAMRDLFPNARVVVVRRPVSDVIESAANLGWEYPDGYLEDEAERLSLISQIPGVLTVSFDDLKTEATCKAVFEHCLQLPFDRMWWYELKNRNIQINTAQQLLVLSAHAESLERIFDNIANYVFCQVEPLAMFLRDAGALLAEHRAEAGGFADLPFDPDIDQFAMMERAGLLLITTARLGNGEMVGYLAFVINPCLESRRVLIGYQNVFFVTREYRGSTGLRLHGFARDALKKRGVTAVVLRSGVRASGPKMKTLFGSLGAKSMGELFFLPLKE